MIKMIKNKDIKDEDNKEWNKINNKGNKGWNWEKINIIKKKNNKK